MILSPYLIERHEPIRRRFCQLPFVNPEQYEHPNYAMNHQVITLDISIVEENINILLGRPDWEGLGIANRAENICSNLAMLMEFCGIIKDRQKVQWFEIVHIMHPMKLQKLYFANDNGSCFSGANWAYLSLEDFPFNLERYANLLEEKKIV
jgi:hypothetical protein